MAMSVCCAQKSISGWKQNSRLLADAVEKGLEEPSEQ
jgi:hypothetical protein